MGDIGDKFRVYREIMKADKAEKLIACLSQLNELSIKYKLDKSYTIHLKTKLGTVLFYPTTGKYQYKKLVKRGDLNSALKLAESLGLVE